MSLEGAGTATLGFLVTTLDLDADGRDDIVVGGNYAVQCAAMGTFRTTGAQGQDLLVPGPSSAPSCSWISTPTASPIT